MNQDINPLYATQDEKFPLQLLMLMTDNETAAHHKNATGIIPFLSNVITQSGVTHDIDFSLFAANYISGAKSFVVTMPKCYATVLQTKAFIIARTEGATYKLEPKEAPYIQREKKIDTGFNWATCTAMAGTTDKFESIKMKLTAIFGKHNMHVVDCKEIFDKEMGGAKNQYRVAFELQDGFDKLSLYKIKDATLASGAKATIKLSNEFHKHHGLHIGCSKTTDNRAAASVRCSCTMAGSGPSTSMANRAAAQSAHKERALKRARETDQTDPFA